MKKVLFKTSFSAALLLVTYTAIAGGVDADRQNELMYFVKHDCGSCHGMTLKGGLGPALQPETLSLKPKEFLVTTILEGRPNTAMPPWKTMLSHDDAVWITEQLLNGNAQQTEIAQSKTPGRQSKDKKNRDIK